MKGQVKELGADHSFYHLVQTAQQINWPGIVCLFFSGGGGSGGDDDDCFSLLM